MATFMYAVALDAMETLRDSALATNYMVMALLVFSSSFASLQTGPSLSFASLYHQSNIPARVMYSDASPRKWSENSEGCLIFGDAQHACSFWCAGKDPDS